MFNNDFYPTPPAVAEKMLAVLDKETLQNAKVLEPSAGKGDLADTLLRWRSYGYRVEDSARSTVHCVECHPDLQATLRGKGYTLVAYDFLTFWPDENYGLILMNPPFSDGAKHLLHAWEILRHGHIVCLLNEQTLLNADTRHKQQLQAIIAQHGEVEHLGACFEDAERKTSVRVSLVHLSKQAKQPHFDFLADGMEQDAHPIFDESDPFAGELATRHTVRNLVLAFDKARDAFMHVAHAVQVLAHYTNLLSNTKSTTAKALAEAVSHLMESGELTCEAQEAAYATYIRGLKTAAWQKVFSLTKAESFMSQRVRAEFDALRDAQTRMAFSEVNIALLIETLFANRHTILRQCVVDAFEYLTTYHKENRLVDEGWKTNESWKVNSKFILPNIVSFEWRSFSLSYYCREKLTDLDRAMASLDGKRLEDVKVSIADAIQDLIRQHGENASGIEGQSDYFAIKIYKKGSAHFRFLSTELWEQFNIEAAKGKNWLPDDYKTRHKEDRKRNKMADERGLPAAEESVMRRTK